MPYVQDGEIQEVHYGLSATTYPVVRVGWLDNNHPFPHGMALASFNDKLLQQLPMVARATRGFQQCLFCEGHPMSIPVEVDGKVFRMGSAEIVVAGQDGTLYSAPNLIYHYVTVHGYLPPVEFQEAVLHPGKLPDEIEASLRKV